MFLKLSPYLIALLIGLIIGVDREKRGTRRTNPMGIRSFIIFALGGALAGGIMQPMVSLGMLIFATSVVLFGYLKTSSGASGNTNAVGLTSEIAAMATFALGYFAHSEPLLSLVLGAIILFVLSNKTLIHNFVREHLRPNEIQGASVLLLLAVGVIPLIPNETIDPFNIVNPRRLAVIIVIFAGIQFGGYAVTRIFGHKIGVPLSGFLAGLASSTAVFLTYPARAHTNPANTVTIVAASIFSITGALCLLVMVVSAISWRLIMVLSVPLSIIIFVTAVIGIILSRRSRASHSEADQRNPLQLLRAIKLGVILTSIIVIVNVMERILGPEFADVVTFTGGLFELHGVVIASANMFENGAIGIKTAASSVMAAVVASMLSKIGITAFASRGNYRRLMLPLIIGLFLVSAALWVILRFNPTIFHVMSA